MNATPNQELLVELALLRGRGVHQYQIAAEAGVAEATLSRYAYGRRIPEPEVAERIAGAIGKPVGQFWPELAAA